MVSEPPRPSVVTSFWVDTPWKPATSTILPWPMASCTRAGWMSRMRALVWTVSVTMPACEPVRLTASQPRRWMAMASRAQLMRSPALSSMSISRTGGLGVISRASSTSSSVVSPRAETTAQTELPCS